MRRAQRFAAAVLGLTALFGLFVVSVRPSVEAGRRPTVESIQAARDVWHQLKAAQATNAVARVRLNSHTLNGLSALFRDVSGLERVQIEVVRGVLSGRASIPMPGQLWINVSATTSGNHIGFPAYHLKVGRIAFPAPFGRLSANLVRLIFRVRGATVPPLDEIVRRVSVGESAVLAELSLTPGSGLVDGLVAARVSDLDYNLAGEIYCRISASQTTDPVVSLESLLRRTFSEAPAIDPEEYSRAAFVALALFVVGDQAERLAPQTRDVVRKCPSSGPQILLHGRGDLAKHWTFSAALTAVLGEDAARNLGEWKELNDSLPDGSGFSFVDLAADRSGVQSALRAIAPESSEAAVADMRRAKADDLLPAVLMQAPEGLSAGQFEDRFGSLEQHEYQRAVRWIDRALSMQ